MLKRMTRGYDKLVDYTKKELADMLIAEGESPHVAWARAKETKQAISRLNKREQRLWDRVREYEEIDPDCNQLTGHAAKA